MELDLFGLCAVCLVGALLCTMLKRYSPEHAFLLSCALGCAALLYLLPHVNAFFAEIQQVADIPSLGENFLCVVKVAGIGMVTQLACDVCTEGGQIAAGSIIALCGRLAAAFAALPIFRRLLSVVLELL